MSFPLSCLPTLLKYIELKDIVKIIMNLNKEAREFSTSENYILYKHFLEYFNLHERLKRADTPAKVNVLQLIKDNLLLSLTSKKENLQPYCYFTDGGTYNDDHYYFIQNIFSRTNICYSTKVPKNSNVQAYLGRKVLVDPSQVSPKLHKVKNEQNMISLPYEKHFADNNEEETLKLVSDLVIHNMGSGYTCFVSAFMIFVSEKEIKTQKSQII